MVDQDGFCTKCGAAVSSTDKFCHSCGRSLSGKTEEKATPSTSPTPSSSRRPSAEGRNRIVRAYIAYLGRDDKRFQDRARQKLFYWFDGDRQAALAFLVEPPPEEKYPPGSTPSFRYYFFRSARDQQVVRTTVIWGFAVQTGLMTFWDFSGLRATVLTIPVMAGAFSIQTVRNVFRDQYGPHWLLRPTGPSRWGNRKQLGPHSWRKKRDSDKGQAPTSGGFRISNRP